MTETINVFARLDYNVKRGLRKIYSIHSLSRNDWNEIKNFFNHKCTFCGKKEDGTAQRKLVRDHLFPAVENGDYVIGNIVSSCSTCNDKRGNQNWMKWLKKTYPSRYIERSSKIRKYLRTHKYKNHPILMRMNKIQIQKYEKILKSWVRVLKRAKTLRKQIISERN
jgi:predicted restriction endonuclease